MKSRDIDVLIGRKDVWKLRGWLVGRGFTETSGEHLGKLGFRALRGDASIDIDVYDSAIGPYRVEELLTHVVSRRLNGTLVRTLRSTELFVLKIVAAVDRRGSEKGAKDLSDLISLIDAVGSELDWQEIARKVPVSSVRLILRTALGDYRTTSKLFPLPMSRYRLLKRRVSAVGLI